MATSSNPFANLARNLAASRLSATSIEKNLANRTGAARRTTSAPAPVASETTEPRDPPQGFDALARRNVRERTIAPQAAARTAEATRAIAPSRSSMFSVIPADADSFDASSIPADDFSGPGVAPAVHTRAPKPPIAHTDEQQAVIECNDRLVVVDAFAGCGKTTTAQGYAAHRQKERMLYLCLNKPNAIQAESRFGKGSNVVVATTHALARRAMRPDQERIAKQWKPVLLMDLLRLRTPREGMVTMRILADFFNSADTQIDERHAQQVAYERDLNASEISNGVAFAALAWKRMLDRSDKMPMPHDAYLKMFALQAPRLDYDTIIFDEAQDANPVTLQIVKAQSHSKLLCIGDRHQSIYQFRGSVNAMDQLTVGSTHLHLSKTWRFGEKVAGIANLLLGELKGETVKIQGMGADAPWRDERVTTLSRTNAELFRMAAPVRGEGVHWVGGVANYRLDQVLDAYHLYVRERTLIKDELMRRKFASWDEYSKYAEDAADGEARVLVNIVEEFQDGVPDLVRGIQSNAVEHSADASMTLTTAHKSKGLDWDYVRISNDFEVLGEAENVLANHPGADMPEQDINLLYVAVTRAKKAVELNDETVAWLKDLPKHRSNREAAAVRRQSALNQQRESLSQLRMA